LDFLQDYPGDPAPERLNQSGLTAARDSEWQWHQLGHMQTYTLTQTHNHASIPPLSFFTGRMPFLMIVIVFSKRLMPFKFGQENSYRY